MTKSGIYHSKLSLPRVALCAVDTFQPELAARALERSMELCDFAEAILVTSIATDAPCRVLKISHLSNIKSYSNFILRQLPAIIEADFVLIVQWDGYVVDPMAWRDDFLNYDYLGATWPHFSDGMNVGNGGFSLRSRKLLDAVATLSLQMSVDEPEDTFVCRRLRPVLESDYNVRFAPDHVASIFSCEWLVPQQPSFGFHGLMNFWRYCNDREAENLAPMIPDRVIWSQMYAILIAQYAVMRKFRPLRALYKRLYLDRDHDELLKHFTAVLRDSARATLIVDLGKILME